MTRDEPRGAIFFFDDAPHITGFFIVGGEEYELVGVRRSKVRVELTGKKRPAEVQMDIFDERSGDGNR